MSTTSKSFWESVDSIADEARHERTLRGFRHEPCGHCSSSGREPGSKWAYVDADGYRCVGYANCTECSGRRYLVADVTPEEQDAALTLEIARLQKRLSK